jgi:hypothetical protein
MNAYFFLRHEKVCPIVNSKLLNLVRKYESSSILRSVKNLFLDISLE